MLGQPTPKATTSAIQAETWRMTRPPEGTQVGFLRLRTGDSPRSVGKDVIKGAARKSRMIWFLARVPAHLWPHRALRRPPNLLTGRAGDGVARCAR
ncbi:Uncharacterised protein [Actinomyces bovis]|uniref:Uncharacterized protein n=1 Tax=Actinomyces bovis TaxID=1658 RepID=A0ABY1VQP5_9ACTO|nr:Uncharacterised protein [Actinomyces bovis]VEG53489.1 Uncharacterised protein [Actinomyces israelii]